MEFPKALLRNPINPLILSPRNPIHIIHLDNGITDFHIGRKDELTKLSDLASKKINLLLTGAQGLGKTCLLDNYNLDKSIRIGDMSSTKKLLAGMLLQLFENDKNDIANTIFEKSRSLSGQKNGIETIIHWEIRKLLADLFIQITQAPRIHSLRFR